MDTPIEPEVMDMEGIKPILSNSNGLSQKQLDALPFLIQGRSLAEKCRNAKISKSSYNRWIREPAFKSAIEATRGRVTDAALRQLESASQEAVTVLIELMKNDSVWVRLRSAETVLASVRQLKEEKEIESKLVEIEKILVERKRFAR
jgi:hypothetical protein